LKRKNIFDWFEIDLAITNGMMVFYMSMNLIIREITGPFFNLFIVQTVLLVQQSFYFALLACIFTLQIVQTLKLFFSPLLTDWTESKVIKAHRIFVFTMGMCTGALVRIFHFIF
jgi:hypothetical protein